MSENRAESQPAAPTTVHGADAGIQPPTQHWHPDLVSALTQGQPRHLRLLMNGFEKRFTRVMRHHAQTMHVSPFQLELTRVFIRYNPEAEKAHRFTVVATNYEGNEVATNYEANDTKRSFTTTASTLALAVNELNQAIFCEKKDYIDYNKTITELVPEISKALKEGHVR